MFFISRSPVGSNCIDWHLACRTKTRATSRAGRILGEKICVAAGTRGLFLTKQFKVARKNGRIRRRFQFNSPNGASNCMASPESTRCWIPFSASVIPRSQQGAVASKGFSDLKSTKLICRKRSGELLAVAAVDPESEIHLASIDSTAPATSSPLTAFMQRKSIGHSRRKQGLHST